MKIIFHLLLSSLAVLIAARLLPGVGVASFTTAVTIAIVLGVINTILRPILMILTLPINIMTLGLFTLVIMGGLVELAAAFVPGFHVENFWWALSFALVLSLINFFFHSIES